MSNLNLCVCVSCVMFVDSLRCTTVRRALLADGHPKGWEVAQGFPQKGVRSPGDGREGYRARDVPTRPRDRTQEQVGISRTAAVCRFFVHAAVPQYVCMQAVALFVRSVSERLAQNLD